MTQQKDGGPAFPRLKHAIEIPLNYRKGLEHTRYESEGGLSLRDYFAGQALTTLLSSDVWRQATNAIAEKDNKPIQSISAQVCYEIADAMLAEREKGA